MEASFSAGRRETAERAPGRRRTTAERLDRKSASALLLKGSMMLPRHPPVRPTLRRHLSPSAALESLIMAFININNHWLAADMIRLASTHHAEAGPGGRRGRALRRSTEAACCVQDLEEASCFIVAGNPLADKMMKKKLLPRRRRRLAACCCCLLPRTLRPPPPRHRRPL
jgi:hypothetical protein